MSREELVSTIAKECDEFLSKQGLLPPPADGETLSPVKIAEAIESGDLPVPGLFNDLFPGFEPGSVQGIVRLAYISVGPWWVPVKED